MVDIRKKVIHLSDRFTVLGETLKVEGSPSSYVITIAETSTEKPPVVIPSNQRLLGMLTNEWEAFCDALQKQRQQDYERGYTAGFSDGQNSFLHKVRSDNDDE